MVRYNLEYPKDVHNTVNKYKHQGPSHPFLPFNCPITNILTAIYALTTIHTLINTTRPSSTSPSPPRPPTPSP